MCSSVLSAAIGKINYQSEKEEEENRAMRE
jgi:hypothetical protein